MLTYENSLTFEKDNAPNALLRNFWEPEDGFVWSTGKWCELTFSFETGHRQAAFNADLMIDVDVFKVDERLPGQNLYLYLNGLRIGSLFCTKRIIFAAPFDPKHLIKSSNIVTIDTPDSAFPKDFGIPDTRSLGLQLFSLQIRKSA